MSQKMERFTPRARFSLNLAQAACEHYQHGLIEPEHVLLGLYDERNGYAGQVLRELGVTREMIVNVLVLHLPQRSDVSLDLSETTKAVLVNAVDVARRRSIGAIGTGCLLLGILRLNRSLTNTILLQNNLSVGTVIISATSALSIKQVSFDEPAPKKSFEVFDLVSLAARLFGRQSSPPQQSASETTSTAEDKEKYERSQVEVLTEMAQIYPENVGIHNNLLGILSTIQDYDVVLNSLNLVLAHHNTYYELFRLRGLTKNTMKDYEGAIADFTRCVELKPDDGTAYCLRGWSYQELNQCTEAVADLKIALERWDSITLDSVSNRKEQIIQYIEL